VEEPWLAGHHGVLPRAELRRPVLREVGQRRARLVRRGRPQPRAGVAPLPQSHRVEVAPHLGVDVVLLGLPRRRRGEPAARRPAVLPVEVPAAPRRPAVGREQQAEAPALVAVEVLHQQPPAPAGPGREGSRVGEELRRRHEADAVAGQPVADRRAVGLRADDVGMSAQRGAERLLAAALHDLDAACAQLRREVAHRAQDELAALPVVAQSGERGARLDHQHPFGAVERGVGVRELVAEDERRVAHQASTTAR
jgi:hypothetical protein